MAAGEPINKLLVVYNGPGIWNINTKQGYWSSDNDKAAMLATSEVCAYIANIKANHVLVLSNGCFTGDNIKWLDSNQLGSRDASVPGREVIWSGTLNSTETKSDWFLSALVKCLEQENNLASTAKIYGKIKEMCDLQMLGNPLMGP
ncbi:MAG: hypothetical protein HC896_01665 [Bacteroidales bacterium]|nr:hypothetical protein [Bacteroidales bacterium]